MNAIQLSLLTFIVLIAIWIFHKTRRIHLMLYQIQDRIDKGHGNIFHQLEALLGLYTELDLRKSLPPTKGWAASPDFLYHISKHVLSARPKVVIECGSGVSTIVVARCLEMNGGGHIFSLDHTPEYASQTRDNLEQHGLSEYATVIDSPLIEYELKRRSWRWYSTDKLPEANIDMLVIDGPPAETGNLARYPAGPLLFGKLNTGGAIFLDDASREQEQAILGIWAQEFPGLTQEFIKTEKGLAVLRKS